MKRYTSDNKHNTSEALHDLHVKWESISNIYKTKIVVLASEPVGGRSLATELPCYPDMCHIHPIYVFFYWECTFVQNFRAIWPLFMDILHFKDLGDTSVVSECSLGVNLVIDNFVHVASDTSPLYKIWK